MKKDTKKQRKPKKVNLPKNLNIRVSTEEKEKWLKYCYDRNIVFSEFVRSALNNKVKRG